MQGSYSIKESIKQNGFAIIENVFTSKEVDTVLETIAAIDSNKPTFRKTNELFAIRQFLKEVPDVINLIFTEKLTEIISKHFGEDYFVVKSIYFDKPALSNWFVSYHQDLTISVNEKIETEGFSSWTIKQNQFSVQPPIEILQSNFTIRIHLDDTDEDNGALKVLTSSHSKGIYRAETIDSSLEKEESCSVKKGGIMIMKPLLFHASNRTTNNKRRRVIHIELSNHNLPKGLQWSEKMTIA